MEGGQSGTYLRLTRASSGPRVSVVKTYRDENEYFGQIKVAFLSSRIHLHLLYSTAEEGHCDQAEIFIIISFHLYVSQRRSPASWTMLSSVLSKCRSVIPSIFVCFLPFQVFLICHIEIQITILLQTKSTVLLFESFTIIYFTFHLHVLLHSPADSTTPIVCLR